VKLFSVVLSRESEIVVLAEDQNAAEAVAMHNQYSIDDYADDWDISQCNEITEGNKRFVADWMPESPYSDLTDNEMLELFGDRDPSCEDIMEFWVEQEKERLAAEAADLRQVKLPL